MALRPRAIFPMPVDMIAVTITAVFPDCPSFREGVTMSRLPRMFSVLVLGLFVGVVGCDPDATTQEGPSAGPSKRVVLVRTPNGGIQPQAVQHKGIHLIYFQGDPKGGDVYYVKGRLQGEKVKWSQPLRVNSRRGSVVAVGNIRGAQLAVSGSGRVHVAWPGSGEAKPKAPGGQTPMLYSRLKDDGTGFEPQRNLVHKAVRIDGGSLAADGRHIFVCWHAPEPGKEGEGNRRVWLVESDDDGKTFAAKERAVSPADTGVCGCCGLRAASSGAGQPTLLYRSATAGIHRDTYFLHGDPDRDGFAAVKLDGWETAMCPMSTFALYPSGKDWLAAWETKGQVFYGHIDRLGQLVRRHAAPGKGGNRKHPVVCCNGRETLLAWTEGLQWGKGGSVAWQIFNTANKDQDIPLANNAAMANVSGRAAGVPPWSLIAAVSEGDRFVIFY